ncbi:hypothetical protein FBY35_3783 [Streptomyces sp. SLBN-118]|uniref:hypothetical protein n=1 Tax=Streptomyces sp. SLBN-118 TaxID=2768454 RepID=UPI00114EEB81|nr:hypothetical protein [Streptomyces sp. SLBN-118]TQK42383.1 hypothetical protein FBY35_3783 [Streptomyces sp. SLBN-118]
MRLADLMGARVLEPTGAEIGHVSDVRLVEHPAPGDISGATVLQIEGLVVATRRRTQLVAYDHRPVEGPWPLARLARKAAHRARWAPWDRIASHHLPERLGEPATIHLRCPLKELPLITDVHHQWAP